MTDVPDIPNTDRIVDYTASAAQTDFDIPWIVIAESEDAAVEDIIVTVDDIAIDTVGLTFVGNSLTGIDGMWNGGALTLADAMTGGERVIIYSQRLPRRVGNFIEGASLKFSTLDVLLDDLFVQMRDLALAQARSLRMSASQYLDGDSTFDSVVEAIELDRIDAQAAATQAAASATTASSAVSQWAVAGGTANAITAALPTTVSVLTDALIIGVRTNTPNTTTTPTLKADGTAAHTITRDGGSALLVGDTGAALSERLYRYNLAHTRWELLNPAMSSSSGTWTPTDASGAGLPITGSGRYTKIGTTVFVAVQINFPTNVSGANAVIGGLPFTASNAVAFNLDGLGLVATDANSTLVFSIQRNTTTINPRTRLNEAYLNSALGGFFYTLSGFYTADS